MQDNNSEENFRFVGTDGCKIQKRTVVLLNLNYDYSRNYFCITPLKQQNGKSHPLTGRAPCLQLAGNFIGLQIMKGKL